MLRTAAAMRHLHNVHHQSRLPADAVKITSSVRRHFFWSNDDSGGNGNDNDNGGKGDGKPPKSINAKEKEKESGDSSEPVASNQAALPTRLGFGDEAPKYPHLTALPIIGKPLFPGIVTSVTVSDDATLDALDKIHGSGSPGGYVGVFLRKKYPNGVTEGGVIVDHPEIITDPSDLYGVGSLAQIHRITHNYGDQDGPELHDPVDADSVLHHGRTASVLLLAHRRIDLISVDKIGPPIDVTCSHWDRMVYKMGEDSGKDDMIRALSNEILKAIRELAKHNPLFRENATFFPTRVDSNDPYRLADFATSMTTGSPEDLQDVLETKDPEARLQKALELLSKERECKYITRYLHTCLSFCTIFMSLLCSIMNTNVMPLSLKYLSVQIAARNFTEGRREDERNAEKVYAHRATQVYQERTWNGKRRQRSPLGQVQKEDDKVL